MVRPPCCDKDGIKRGPWTPEEDIILASYIQQNGPGNWRSVPTNTGLVRCSKSCRLRWTNYLRPGIKRGNFTAHEERMIVHLQAILGNKWASIASYLPQRTDNDVKNYWNTHLKKKINKFQLSSSLSPIDPHSVITDSAPYPIVNKRSYNSKSLNIGLSSGQSSSGMFRSSTYASSTENISRLLEGWMKSTPKATVKEETTEHCDHNEMMPSEDLESLLSFDSMSSITWEKPFEEPRHDLHHLRLQMTLNNVEEKLDTRMEGNESNDHQDEEGYEKWFSDEAQNNDQVEDIMPLSPIF